MEENNFFDFVSKIGSLIGNNKPKETKKPKVVEKKFNIKISSEVEDEKEQDNIDNMDIINDDEEEEEEEDEEDNKETEEEKKKREEKEKKEKEEKEKIQNLVSDILNDNDTQKKEEDSNEDLNDNIINEDNGNNINNNGNNNNCPQILNNAFPVSNNNNGINDAFMYDETSSCHLMLKKGNDININDFIVFPIIFMEKQKNIFYKIGMTNTPNYEQKKYLFFFDEHYLYFAKDEILSEEMDDNTRRIAKIVSLFDIKDFSNDHINEQFIIKLTIQKEFKKEKIISFYIEENNFPGFIKNFNLKLSIYGIDFFTDKNNNF